MPTVAMSLVLLSFSAGPGHCGHDRIREACTVCEHEGPKVAREIARLQSAGWLSRRKAARALRAFEWKSHPEAAEALAEALTHDDCGLVRQEAAESLARMRPCLPDVHEAVARAARCDASLLTRHWAKKALKALARGCVEDCSLCDAGSPGMEFGSGPVSDALVVPRSPAIVPGPPAWEQAPFPPGESLGPEIGEVPPLEAPALPSPFGPSDRVGPGLTAPR